MKLNLVTYLLIFAGLIALLVIGKMVEYSITKYLIDWWIAE